MTIMDRLINAADTGISQQLFIIEKYGKTLESFINLIGTPLGYIMHWCFELLRNYGAAILLFTLLTKIILFPLSLIAQKNSIKMVKMQPELADIKMRNAGNGELIMQETKALYKKERYSTFAGILPLLVQIPLILGLIDVIYNPLRHILRLGSDAIVQLKTRTAELLGMSLDELGYGAEIRVLETVQENPDAYQDLASSATLDATPIIPEAIKQIQSVDVSFLGIDLAAIPSFTEITILIPILSGLSALVLCLVQNRYNVLQAEAGFVSKWGMTIFLVAFSSYFALILPCGLGLYWTVGNLLSIPVLALCNLIYSPKKYIDYANRVIPTKLSRAEKAELNKDKTALAKREKADSKRFFAPGLKKNLVVYSEGSGYWKYFSAIVNYVIEKSDIVVHYVTNDPNDRIFENDNPQIVPYYIGPKALIAFMMKMDADIIMMTTPDIELFHIKRSIVRKDVEYIYLDHSMTSLQLMLRKNSLDHFDTIFCYGPNHIVEARETEKLYQAPQKALVKTGYGLLDELLERVEALEANQQPDKPNKNKQLLIAPSWQPNNILDLCLDDLLSPLLGKGYNIIVRPHPEYVKLFPQRMKAIIERYEKECTTPDELGGLLRIETDFSSNETVYLSDLVITDWSTIAQEFSYATKKPSLFINTPMKTMNPEWNLLPLVPLDISLRDELGVSADTDKLATLDEVVADLLIKSSEYRSRITEILNENIYDIGNAAQGAGEYLIARVKEIEYLKSVGKDPGKIAPPAQLKAKILQKQAEKNRGKANPGALGAPVSPETTARKEAI